MTPSPLTRALDWAYDHAVAGLPGLDSAHALAAASASAGDDARQRVERLIRRQLASASAVGFLAGLTASVSLPAALPANVAALLFVQIRLVAAIAAVGGHDLDDPRVRRLVYLCLTADRAPELLADAGGVVGRRLSRELLAAAPGRLLATLDRRIARRMPVTGARRQTRPPGRRLLTLVGALVGAAADAQATQRVARAARAVFMPGAAAGARRRRRPPMVARATKRS
jgi:hypothetical protein